MTPPRICPPPPDCPLYDQRLVYGSDEPLRRAVLMERHRADDLQALVRAEALQANRPQVLLPPAPTPEPVPLPLPSHLSHLTKGATQ